MNHASSSSIDVNAQSKNNIVSTLKKLSKTIMITSANIITDVAPFLVLLNLRKFWNMKTWAYLTIANQVNNFHHQKKQSIYTENLLLL